jgi:hypothetical protein
MAVKTTDQLVTETLQELQTQLDPSVSRTRQPIIAIIKSCFKASFTQEGIDKKALYQKLSIEVHPDSLSKKHTILYTYLTGRDLVSELRQSLNMYNDYNVYDLISNIFNYPLMVAGRYLFIQEKTRPMSTPLERYIEPFKTASKVVVGLIDVVAAFSILPFTLSLAFVNIGVFIPQQILRAFTWLAIKNEYVDLADNHNQDKQVLARAVQNHLKLKRMFAKVVKPAEAQYVERLTDEAFLKKLKETATYIDNLDDEAFMNKLMTDLVNKVGTFDKAHILMNDEIAKFIMPTQSLKLAWLALSFYRTLTRPLPETRAAKFAAILLIRPLKFLLGVTFLPAAAALEALRIVGTGLSIAAGSLPIFLHVAVIAIAKTPLYIYDALHKPQNPPADVDSAALAAVSSHLTMLALGAAPGSDTKRPAADPPMHTGLLFSGADSGVAVPVSLEGTVFPSAGPAQA